MAQLKAPAGTSGLQIEELAPVGTHLAVCLRVNDLFGVERQKFQSQEMELKDVTRFVFGLLGPDNKPYLVQTFEFTISGAPGSNLMAFLTAWLGRTPEMGWDYAVLKGQGAQLTIQHKAARKTPGKFYSEIASIAPVLPQLLSSLPNPALFEPLLQKLESGGAPGAAAGRATAAPAAPAAAPAAPTNFAPPPAPAARPERDFFVFVNGAATPVKESQLAGYPPGTPACQKGDAAWRKVSDYVTASPAGRLPPPPAAAGGAPDDDVPF